MEERSKFKISKDENYGSKIGFSNGSVWWDHTQGYQGI
jgi:hypothetical protein